MNVAFIEAILLPFFYLTVMPNFPQKLNFALTEYSWQANPLTLCPNKVIIHTDFNKGIFSHSLYPSTVMCAPVQCFNYNMPLFDSRDILSESFGKKT